ncbi:FtsW/RodA/SpoVE family cell cycle protein [Arcobacter sp. FWKO B]|uniref:FtsW/RodA/SpoVE family cell cycle protein n=1 Tax=Arcobacter sp. FWKO B TaxID=2593672 RepID=UPI0018A51772|nr:FtsW/RodA/SpoVE family cell cycle protein [Arcobacter sp. FWKO B]QOG13292.1 cell division protein [Arcobacter sp. FWKO B]
METKSYTQPDYLLFVLATTLIIISIVFSYSLSVYTVLNYDYNQFHFFIRQLLVGCVSISIMWFLAHMQPDKIIKIIGFSLFFIFLTVMLLMPFLPSFLVTEAGGANRWIRLPGFSLSPVEFFKIGFIYFLAWSFHRRILDKPKKMSLKDETLLLLPYFGVFGLVVFLVAFLQKDLGQIVLLGLILFIMMIFANRSFKIFMILGAIAGVVITALILVAPHRINRVQSWWSMVQDGVLMFLPKWADEYLRVKEFPEPYQVGHSLNAIANGGFSGTGISEGFLKLGFLSEVHTDFVLAGITEEAGFFGLMIVLSLIMLVVWRIFKVSARVKDPIYHLFTLGIGLMIVIAFLINAYGISGIIPIKGIAVPFLSYGGSALLAMSICIGLVLSISKEVENE